MFSRANALAWESFSDYTHGGLRQLSRWLTPTGVGPIHAEEEVASILPVSDHLALLACAGLFHIAGVNLAPLYARIQITNERQAARMTAHRGA